MGEKIEVTIHVLSTVLIVSCILSSTTPRPQKLLHNYDDSKANPLTHHHAGHLRL